MKYPIPRKGTETRFRPDNNYAPAKKYFTTREGAETLFPPALPAAASRKQSTPPARGRELHGIGHRDIDAGNTLPP